MDKQIEIKIQPNGKLSIDLVGFNGEGCSKVAQQFIEALGRSVQSNRKDEYYEGCTDNKNSQKNQL